MCAQRARWVGCRRTPRRIITDCDRDPWKQLYDVAADPAEAHDLLALGADVGEAARRALSLLRAALQAHLDGAFVGSECLAVPAEGSDGRSAGSRL